MKRKHKIIIGAVIATALAGGLAFHNNLSVQNQLQQRIAPAFLYPLENYTPGKADTLLLSDLNRTYNGQTYSQSHRNVPQSEKQQVCDEYKTCDMLGKAKEIDHFYPLCAGGSNNITNLWPQPENNQWNGVNYGYHEKDKLESYICMEIKAGRLDPKEAYQRMITDWVKFYQDVFKGR